MNFKEGQKLSLNLLFPIKNDKKTLVGGWVSLATESESLSEVWHTIRSNGAEFCTLLVI